MDRVAVAHIKAVEQVVGIGEAEALTFAIAQESLGQTVFQSGIHTVDAIVGIGQSVEVEFLHTCQVAADSGIAEVFARKAERIYLCHILEYAIHPAVGTFARQPHGPSAFKIVGTCVAVGSHLRPVSKCQSAYILAHLVLVNL